MNKILAPSTFRHCYSKLWWWHTSIRAQKSNSHCSHSRWRQGERQVHEWIKCYRDPSADRTNQLWSKLTLEKNSTPENLVKMPQRTNSSSPVSQQKLHKWQKKKISMIIKKYVHQWGQRFIVLWFRIIME